MSTIRTFGAIAVMIACFAVVYPRFMHPFVLKAFGLNTPPPKPKGDDMFPPGFKGMVPPTATQEKKDPNREDLRRQMRHGPHPGMRAAAEMQRQQSQQGTGRGMMGVVLPMYAIGIVLYLVYTLFKVFNKSKNNSWSRPNSQDNRRRFDDSRGDPKEIDRMGFPTDFDGRGGDVGSFLQDRQKRKDLEDLLTRVDDKNVSVEEMRLLQARLEETEMQMTRILRAMQSVQSNVDKVAAGVDLSGLATDDGAEQQGPDSNPDIDDFEAVSQGNQGKQQGPKKNTKLESEALKQKEGASKKQEMDLDGIDNEEDVDSAQEEDWEDNAEDDVDNKENDVDNDDENVAEKMDKGDEKDESVRHRKVTKPEPEP